MFAIAAIFASIMWLGTNGVSYAQTKPEAPSERLPQPTTVTGINSANFLLYIIAKDIGALERYNIILEEKLATVGGVAVMPVIVSGEADTVENGASAAIIARARGARVTSIAAGYVAGADFDTVRYYVRGDSPITSAKDLEGKRVAVVSIGSTPDIALTVWLSKNGADSTKVQRVAVPFANMSDALMNDQVDAISLIDTFYRPLESSDNASKVRLLFRDRDGLPTDKLFTAYTFSDEYVAANPDVIRAFVAALKETLAWVNEHPDEARQVISKHYNLPMEKLAVPGWPKNLCIDPAAAKEWVDALVKVGQVEANALPSPTDWMTNKFNPDCAEQ